MTRFILPYIIIFLSFTCVAQDESTPEIIRGNEKLTLIVTTEEIASNKTLSNVEIYLYETKSDELISTASTQNGIVEFSIEPFREYEIRSCHPDYFKNGLSIFECNEGNEVLCALGASDYEYVAGGGKEKPYAFLKATLQLSPMTVGSIFKLSNVYYDLDKATLRPEGKQELDELATILKRNKSIKIELSSHTDSRASDAYNIQLSKERANSCYDYLKSKGIDPQRIVPKGYGESKLLNKCKDGVECTEAQHQLNRRTEIEVLQYTPIECAPSKEVDFEIKDLSEDPDDQ